MVKKRRDSDETAEADAARAARADASAESGDGGENRDPVEGEPQSWKQRHGGSLIAAGSGLLLAAVVGLQMNC